MCESSSYVIIERGKESKKEWKIRLIQKEKLRKKSWYQKGKT